MTPRFYPYKQVRVADVTPYARNARTHSPAQIAQLVASIRRFGFTNPVLVDAGGQLIAGHGRILAARELGLLEVPAIVLAGLSVEEQAALVIADNKLALNAGWDVDLLTSELAALRDADFDLTLTGFSDDELAALLAETTTGLTDPDDAPPVEERVISRPGDVWRLGRHRLGCGDSTDPEVVARVLAGVRPHLMVTDPPYGVEYDPAWRAEAGINKSKEKMGKVLNDDRADWRDAWALFPGDVAYVWCAPGPLQVSVHESLVACAFEPRQQIVWAKDQFALGRGHYHYQHEPCWYAVRKGGTGHWAGDRKQSSVWQIKARDDAGHGHSTQKPVECMRRPIENNSNPGQAVYEPFSGSGTTIVAAEMTGRACHAIELNPQYVDVAVRRWQTFTGKAATLEADGRTFAEMEAADARPA